MMTNFDAEYSNTYYHSLYDTAEHHGYNVSLGPEQPLVQHLSKVSLVLARTVLSLTDSDPDSLSGKPELVNSMLQCYSVSANCSLFKESSSSNTGFPWTGPEVRQPWPQYVGVNVSPHTRQTKLLLQLLTGTKVDLPQTEVTESDGQQQNVENKSSSFDWDHEAERCRDQNSDSSQACSV